MIKREAELLCSKAAQRALHLAAVNKRAVTYQIQLRVVREFGLPDSSAEILHNSQHYHHHHQQQQRAGSSPYLSPQSSYVTVYSQLANATPIVLLCCSCIR